MRRRQLVDLAKAFGLKVDPMETKSRLLPTMIAAEQRGVFRGQPVDQGALAMAGWNCDAGCAPPVIHAPPPEPKEDTGLDKYHALRRQVAELHPDLNLHGMNKEDLQRKLEESDGR